MLLALLSLALFLCLVNNIIFFAGGDNAEYFMLARSLAHGHGYVSLYDFPVHPHTKYPFLFPLILAGVMVLAGENVLMMKILIAALAAVMVAATAVLWNDRGERRTAIMTTLLVATAPYAIYYAPILLSEIPYTAFSCLSLVYFERAARSERPSYRDLAASVIFLIAAYFTRSIGLALAPALMGAVFFKGHFPGGWKRKLFIAGLVGLPFLSAAGLWHLRCYVATKGMGESYVREFLRQDPENAASPRISAADLLSRAAENAGDYSVNLCQSFTPFYMSINKRHQLVIGIIILVIIIGGFIVALERAGGAPELYTAAYALVILAWGFYEPRFLIPLLPMLAYYFVVSLEAMAQKAAAFSGRARYAAAAAAPVIVLALLISNLVYDAERIDYVRALRRSEGAARNAGYKILPMHKREARLLGLAERLGRATGPDAVIFSDKGPLVALASGRRTVGGPFAPDPDGFISQLEKSGAGYIIVADGFPRVRKYFLPALGKYPGRFKLMFCLPTPEQSCAYKLIAD
ncbi:MAG TPA: glycosyltransferase family 39 protein [bacterium]|nr:glycosyltransferase family 39 protein [bacterium]